MTKSTAVVLLACVAGIFAAPPAFSQDYPSKTVRIIVGFSPGGGNDIAARIVARQLSEMYKQQFVVENRPGAGTIIGVDAVAKADPDGYTLLVTNNSLAVNHTLYPKLPYDTLKDIAPIVKVGSTPNILVIHPSLPVKSAAQFIALAKAQPDKIAYSSAGTGSTAFLAAEMLKLLTGIKMLHVPYKGTAPALTAILSGETQAMVGALPATVPHIRNGRLRALAVTSARRATAMKDIPTMIEAGVKDFDFETWYGLFGPGRLSRDLIAKLNASVNKIIALPAVREQFERQGIDPEGGTTAAFEKQFRAEVTTLGKVIRASGAKPE
ncbi:MAG: Bug family tripartite tricarboxylate transporter substrate binding protein [Burkholderiales bacterium]